MPCITSQIVALLCKCVYPNGGCLFLLLLLLSVLLMFPIFLPFVFPPPRPFPTPDPFPPPRPFLTPGLNHIIVCAHGLYIYAYIWSWVNLFPSPNPPPFWDLGCLLKLNLSHSADWVHTAFFLPLSSFYFLYLLFQLMLSKTP